MRLKGPSVSSSPCRHEGSLCSSPCAHEEGEKIKRKKKEEKDRVVIIIIKTKGESVDES